MRYPKKIQVKIFIIKIINFIGIWEGKILERGNYKNDENNDIYFNITDFYINKSIRINSNSYFIFDADEFTKKWLAVNLI